MKHVAVIGSGIAGLATAYLLSRRHHVSLYERATRLGGHTNTVMVDGERGPTPLDTGFLVFNDHTYPHLTRLFAEIGIESEASDMSFSVRCPASGLEYSSRGLGGFFAQPRSILRPDQYSLLFDIVRFNREAVQLLTTPGAESLTLGEYLDTGRFGGSFATRYLLPMASAIWSASLDCIDRFPAQTLVRFMHNHGMLSLRTNIKWRVVRGGSCSYIPRLAAPLGAGIHLGAQLISVRRHDDHVSLTFADRPTVPVDDVVFACHGDQVLPLLADASDTEHDVFRQFTTTTNETILHTDARSLPAAPRAQASWNYLLGSSAGASPSVTYDLNRLQNIAGPTRYCVTLNPQAPLADGATIARFEYRHPRVTVESMKAQDRWREVSGVRRTHYCGAYWRYGFHEDGLMSAVRVASDFGVAW